MSRSKRVTVLVRERADADPVSAAITADDFELIESRVSDALDLVAICHGPNATSRAGR